MPPGTLGLEALGKVTDDDYANVLAPAVAAGRRAGRRTSALCPRGGLRVLLRGGHVGRHQAVHAAPQGLEAGRDRLRSASPWLVGAASRRGRRVAAGGSPRWIVETPASSGVAKGPENPRKPVFGWLPVEVGRRAQTTWRAAVTVFSQVRPPFQAPGRRPDSLEDPLRKPRGFVAWSLEFCPAEFWSSRNRPAEPTALVPEPEGTQPCALGTRATAVKIFASVVLVGGAASVAALGTYGSFTSTTSASETVSTGKVVLNSAAGVRGLSIDATNLVPGDTVQRTVTLSRSNDTESFGSVKLTTTATTSNVLTSRRHQRPAAEGRHVPGRPGPSPRTATT